MEPLHWTRMQGLNRFMYNKGVDKDGLQKTCKKVAPQNKLLPRCTTKANSSLKIFELSPEGLVEEAKLGFREQLVAWRGC